MDERVIDLSESAAGLKIKLDQLVIGLDDREESISIEDVAALIVAHPAVHYTQAVLTRLCESSAAFIL